MSGDAVAYAVEHYKTALGYGRLHSRRLSDEGHIDVIAFPGQMWQKGTHASFAGHFFFGCNGKYKIILQVLVSESAEYLRERYG